jgi:hypothetical protein
VQTLAVLVESGGQAERSGEPHPEHGAGQNGIAGGEQPVQSPPQDRHRGDGAQQREHPGVDPFGGDEEQQPPQRGVCGHWLGCSMILEVLRRRSSTRLLPSV